SGAASDIPSRGGLPAPSGAAAWCTARSWPSSAPLSSSTRAPSPRIGGGERGEALRDLVAQDQGRVRDQAAAVAGDDADLGVLDLTLRLDLAALELLHRFRDVQHALDVGLAEQAAVGVHG